MPLSRDQKTSTKRTSKPDRQGPLPRKEDARLITGRGRFSDDFNLGGPGLCGDGALAPSACPHPRHRCARARAMPGVLGVFTGADCLADGLGADPARSAAEDQDDMKLTGPAAHDLHRPAPAAAGRQGAPRRRGGRHGGGRDRAGARRRRGGRGRLRGAALRHPFGRRDAAGRAGGLGRGARQHPGRHPVRRRGGHRRGLRARRSRGEAGLPHRPRHRRADRAARRSAVRHATGRYTLYAGSGGAVRQNGSSPPCSASRPTSCASCRTTSAATSAPATASSSSSAWCCGRRASSAGRSNTPPPARKPSSATTRAATWSPRSSWRSTRTAASSPCAPPTSATSARAASRCRR